MAPILGLVAVDGTVGTLLVLDGSLGVAFTGGPAEGACFAACCDSITGGVVGRVLDPTDTGGAVAALSRTVDDSSPVFGFSRAPTRARFAGEAGDAHSGFCA